MRAYGELQLTVSSPPQSFTEPLLISQLVSYLRLDSDTSEEADIAGFITAARVVAEICQGKDLIPKQYDLNLDLLLGYDALGSDPLRFNSLYNLGTGYEIPLRYPLQSVDLFQYTNNGSVVTNLVPTTDYLVDAHRALVMPPFGQVWPYFVAAPSSAVLIRFTSGYSSTHPFWKNQGQVVLQGMRLLISGWYEQRFPYSYKLEELPYGITELLSFGGRPRVR